MNKKFLITLIIILFILKYFKFININIEILIILALIIIGIVSGGSKLEFLTKSSGDFDEEAIANIASIYNTNNMKVTDLEVTNKVTIGQDTIINGNLIVTGNISSQNEIASNTMRCNSFNATDMSGNSLATNNVKCNSLTANNDITCSSFNATNALTTPYATIGQFTIRNKQIGIPGNIDNANFGYDLNFGNDGWIRHVYYNQDGQADGTKYVAGRGLATSTLWVRGMMI